MCAISLAATFVMACLLWCTCHLCGWGPLLELMFALLGLAWWLAAALVLQVGGEGVACGRVYVCVPYCGGCVEVCGCVCVGEAWQEPGQRNGAHLA